MNRADANGDGFVSLYELRAAYYADIEFNRRIEESFAAYDTDGDGLISEAERRATEALAANDAEPEPEAIPPTRSSGEAAFAAAAPTTLPATVAEVSSMSAAATASAANPGTDTVASNTSGGVPDTAAAAAAPPPFTPRLSRSESWILTIDTDNSGGASYNELLASNDGDQFFPSEAFVSAESNDDGELDADELEVLIQSIERRQRYQQRGR